MNCFPRKNEPDIENKEVDENIDKMTLYNGKAFERFVSPGEVVEVRIPKIYGKSAAWGNEYAKGTVSGYLPKG